MNINLMLACDLYWINRRLETPQAPHYASVGPVHRYDPPRHSVPDAGPSLGALALALAVVFAIVARRK